MLRGCCWIAGGEHHAWRIRLAKTACNDGHKTDHAGEPRIPLDRSVFIRESRKHCGLYHLSSWSQYVNGFKHIRFATIAVSSVGSCPLLYNQFMKAIRDAAGVHVALPATRLMLEIGAFFMRTETELV